jgi:hypothetical protein
MKKSRIVSIAFYALSAALFGCGGGGSGGNGASMPGPPPTANTSLEVFVRDALKDDETASPREINDVPFTTEVQEAAFDDVFPT